MKKLFNSKTLVRFVFCTFLASTVYIVIRLIMAPSGPASPEQDFVVKSDYALMLLQCVLGLAVMLLPGILQRKAKLAIPSGMVIAFAVFLFCAIYLGEVHYFYFRIPHWDTMLHTFSGFALGAIGLSIVGLLHVFQNKEFRLSVIGSVLMYAVMMAGSMLLPIYIQSIRGNSATFSSMIMLPGSLVMAIASPFAGKIYDKIGIRKLFIVGSIGMFISCIGLSFLNDSTNMIIIMILFAVRSLYVL